MPSAACGGQLQDKAPLLGDANHGDGGRNAGDESMADGQPLIDQVFEPDAPRSEERGDLGCALVTPDLLIVAEGEIDGPAWPESLGQKRLHGLENPEPGDLVVHGAPAPDVAVSDAPGKGRVSPAVLGPGLDRHHVEVAHEENRLLLTVGAFPGIEEAVVVDHFSLQCAMHVWEGHLEKISEVEESLRVELPRILMRDGLEAEGFR